MNINSVQLISIALILVNCNLIQAKEYYPYNCPTYSSGRVGRTNPNVRLHDIKWDGSDRTFDNEIEICKLCLDATLPMHDETKYASTVFPRWIGLYRLAGSTEWKWMDGTVLNNWHKYADFFNHDQLLPDKDYGVLAMRVSGRSAVSENDSLVWIALERTSSCADRTTIRNPLIRMGLITVDTVTFVCNFTIWSQPWNGTYMTTCQRPYRPTVHYWNYTESTCVQGANGVSYNYFMPNCHPGDARITQTVVKKKKKKKEFI